MEEELGAEPLRGLTVDEAARRYVLAQLRGRGRGWRELDRAHGQDAWICGAMYGGGWPSDHNWLPRRLWFELIVAAADLAIILDPNDERGLLFGLGDGCSDHLVGEDRAASYRLHAARPDHPGVEAMFAVMQEEAADLGCADRTWWADDYPARNPDGSTQP